MFEIGDVIDDQYRIVRLIGEGGHRLHDRLAQLAGALSFNASGLIQRIKLVKQILSVTQFPPPVRQDRPAIQPEDHSWLEPKPLHPSIPQCERLLDGTTHRVSPEKSRSC